MKTITIAAALALGLTLIAAPAQPGPIDPDCTVEKGVKGAAAKATVGVGGRCKPGEVASDSAKRAVGLDDKKRKNRNGGLAKKTGKKIID